MLVKGNDSFRASRMRKRLRQRHRTRELYESSRNSNIESFCCFSFIRWRFLQVRMRRRECLILSVSSDTNFDTDSAPMMQSDTL